MNRLCHNRGPSVNPWPETVPIWLRSLMCWPRVDMPLSSVWLCLQGNRDHIDGMAAGSQKVLQDVLKLIDTYDLYGTPSSVVAT